MFNLKVLKLRFLNPQDQYIEVYCHGEHRSYFKRLTKEQAKADKTTIRPRLDKKYEIRLMTRDWEAVSEETFMKHLTTINIERLPKGWLPIY